ncbi:acyl carrier protein [Streptacidiphilus sp. N1-12]|uniref:Acyl carrier protein n=2 Tax=Streptacidiphilus alkalitolerans TaxID=3342712 RepID=A0ABV6WHQ1_9ACTN
MTGIEPPGRAEVLVMLAAFGDRAPEAVQDALGSLELTWLIAELEQRYGVELDLSDERFDAIRTVDDAVAVLGEAMGGTRSVAAAQP